MDAREAGKNQTNVMNALLRTRAFARTNFMIKSLNCSIIGSQRNLCIFIKNILNMIGKQMKKAK